MSRLGTARGRILAALEAGGVRAATTGRHSAPVVILEPAEPWTEPVRMPGRHARFQLIAIAGATDADAALEELATFVDSVDAALRTLDGCGLPTWARPTDRPFGDTTLPAMLGTFSIALE